ncbi:YL1 nuclear protein-domain-containing protein [Irpex rosettiformis]|uniref:YL1 nuclear protein-domain-containing protein n=1 Tax=Irpex rosettiformis TaxID=378272 RepID=A0ACB8U718_9APHY|nr:YL1 nuclear protein-domain-containing protein [Irpex rosettiformis]
MTEDEGTLVMRRSRRSTAGNRMEAVLAEFKAEELGQDIEEDNDFVVELDEQDAFESDFESTDEEGAQEDVDAAAERMVTEEEKRKRKTGRSHLERITAAAHARQKATFNPEAIVAPVTKLTSAKLNRRVSLGTAVDAETGAVLEGGKRKSSRRHTMMNSSMTQIRAKDELEKKSSVSRRVKVKTQALTQDQLIARALDMEDGNIKEHRNYLQMEEEKRKRARVVRTAVEGPLIRWISRAEEITVLVQPPPPPPVSLPPPPPPPTVTPMPQYPYHYASAPASYASSPAPITPQYASSHMPSAPAYPSPRTYTPPVYSPHTPPQPPAYYPSPQPPASPMTFVNYSYPSQSLSVAPPPPPVEKVELVTKNYVIHETSQEEDASKPLWKETMAAMFGDHVRWDTLKVYAGKGRPLSRPKDICPITGQIAKYRDPRTGVPFANIPAFNTLTKIISHDFVWSERLGCYVSTRSEDGANKRGDNSSHDNERTMS